MCRICIKQRNYHRRYQIWVWTGWRGKYGNRWWDAYTWSSRFWPAEGYEPGHGQPSFDKQFARDWLKANPDNNWTLPQDIVDKTIEKYLQSYEMLTGKKLAWLFIRIFWRETNIWFCKYCYLNVITSDSSIFLVTVHSVLSNTLRDAQNLCYSHKFARYVSGFWHLMPKHLAG